jgi:hypothetical protein
MGGPTRRRSTGPAITKAKQLPPSNTRKPAIGGQTELVTARADIPPRLPTLTVTGLWGYQFGIVATPCQHGKHYGPDIRRDLIYSREN